MMYMSSEVANVLVISHLVADGPIGFKKYHDNLDIDVLLRVIECVSPNNIDFAFCVISRSAFQARSRSRARRLTKIESERVIRLAMMFAAARSAGARPDKMVEFFACPHPALGGMAPRDMVHKNSAARDIVLDLVDRQVWTSNNTP